MLIACIAVVIGSCETKQKETKVQVSESEFKNEKVMMKIKETNFYKDGAFDKVAAKEAYFDLMRYYGNPVTPIMKSDEFWVSDFAQKDFATVGMGGIFWVNNVEHGYFGHDILLLPGQMLVEHKHLPVGDIPAKMETWQVRHGSAYFFAEGEGAEPLPVKVPESQNVHCKKAKLLVEGDLATLQAVEEWHFIIAGPKGAIISEYATPHHGDALVFANETVVF